MSERSHDGQVLVVGAGPVGLVAACELARHGVVPRVVEALAVPTVQSRAVGVQPRSQEMLATLGVLDRFLAVSPPQHRIEIDQPDGDGFRRLTGMDLAHLPTRHPSILDLPQTDTEALLHDRAAELGVTVERGVTLTDLRQDPDGVEVVLRSEAGEERTRVGYVVGADGGRSAVRGVVGSALQGTFTGSHFAMADVVVESDYARDVTRLFASPGGLTVMMCMLGGRTRLLFQVPDPGPDAGEPTLELIQELATARMGHTVRVSDPSWLTYYSVHQAQVPQYRVGRVFLGGDAAHIHSPAAAQGMNTGMQDAANLAWKLALVCRGLASSRLLDSYHAERHPVGAAVVRKATVMARSMTLTGVPAVARNTGMRIVGHSDRLTQAMAKNIAQLTVAYRHSPIVRRAAHVPHGALRPGEHLDDLAELTDPAGAPVLLEELLRDRPGHLLLTRVTDADALARLRTALGDLGSVVPVVGRPEDVAPDAVVDPTGALVARYGLGDAGLVLIRPDGYVACVCISGDPGELRDYLDDVGLGTSPPVAVGSDTASDR